jgi:hypothetical protein
LKNNITSLFSLLGDQILPLGDQKKRVLVNIQRFSWGGGGMMTQSHHIFSKKFEIAKFIL